MSYIFTSATLSPVTELHSNVCVYHLYVNMNAVAHYKTSSLNSSGILHTFSQVHALP